MKQQADAEIFQLLIQHKIITAAIAPKVPVIPDARPLQQRIREFLPVLTLLHLLSGVNNAIKAVWQIVLNRYPEKTIVKVIKVIAFLVSQAEAVGKALIAKAQARRPPKRIKIIRWLVSPGEVIDSNTPILEYRFVSRIPYRYRDTHQLIAEKPGVLVQALAKPSRTVRRKFYSFIPLEAYTLLAQAKQVTSTMVLPAQTVQTAIAQYKSEIQTLEQDHSLNEADKRILKAQLMAQLNRLFALNT